MVASALVEAIPVFSKVDDVFPPPPRSSGLKQESRGGQAMNTCWSMTSMPLAPSPQAPTFFTAICDDQGVKAKRPGGLSSPNLPPRHQSPQCRACRCSGWVLAPLRCALPNGLLSLIRSPGMGRVLIRSWTSKVCRTSIAVSVLEPPFSPILDMLTEWRA
jgi:hypothetical protein